MPKSPQPDERTLAPEPALRAVAPQSPAPLVDVINVSKRYGRTLALDSVSLEIQAGERFAILGPNGAGKTTLIHILCTIHRADSGTVTVADFDVNLQPKRVRERLGVVFQEPSLDTRLTVEENLRFHGRIFGVSEREIRRRIDDLLELVELGEWRDKLVRTLSKGMPRRLEIARALVHDATLLVLDEPTVGLDAQTRLNIWRYLSELQAKRELTVLVTTHYIEEVEVCDRVCIIDGGKILALGSPKDLKERHGQPFVRLLPRDEPTAELLKAELKGVEVEGHELTVPLHADVSIEHLLETYGARLRAFTVEQPSLESVFLNLTGRTIRDQAADPLDRLLQFARQGGEHTR